MWIQLNEMKRRIPEGEIPEDYTKKLIWEQLCLQKELGFGGALFGGEMMSFLDKAAAMFLMKKCKTKYMRTVHMDVKFTAPVLPGDIIQFYGEIIGIGDTSATVEIDICKIDVENKEVSPVGEATATFVRVSEDGKKRKIEYNVRKRIKKEVQEREAKKNEVGQTA